VEAGIVTDWELLEQYADHGSEAAFGELVERYKGLVYSSALRRAGKEHADDVAQAVFILLANKAGQLHRGRARSLAGWLFRATRFSASEALRSQARRREREKAAAKRQQEEAAMPDVAGMWQGIRPQLDTALDRLPGRYREAVLLRYFQGLSHADAAAAMGISENAAAKRVSRAVEKLRRYFAARHVNVSVPVMATLLSSEAIEALPAGLGGALSASAVAAGEAGLAGTAALIAKGAAKSMLMAQAKVAAATSVATAGAVGAIAAVTVATSALSLPFTISSIEMFPLRYEARSTLPDGSMQFQVNRAPEGSTHFVRLYEEIGGYSVAGHTMQHEKRDIPGLSWDADVDVSRLTLRRADEEIALTKGEWLWRCAVSVPDERGGRGTVRLVAAGEAIEAGDETYTVEAVDAELGTVRIRREPDGKTTVVRMAPKGGTG